MTDTGSIRSSEGACSSLGDERERARVVQKITELKDKLKANNESGEARIEKFLAVTRQSEVERGVGCDNPQLVRIRANFERQNKRHTQETEMLKRKLHEYEQKLAALDKGEYEPSPSRSSVISQGIRKAGANMKGMTETVMTAPMEFAHKIKTAFGSADNVNVSRTSDGQIGHSTFFTERRSADNETDLNSDAKLMKHTKPNHSSVRNSSTLPPNMSLSCGIPDNDYPMRPGSSDDGNISQMYRTANNSLCSPPNAAHVSHLSAHDPYAGDIACQINDQLKTMIQRINGIELKYDQLAKDVSREIEYYTNALEEERFKITKLEGILNETIELHQAELSSLKEQNLMAVRVDYQHNDRFKNIEERIESVQNHMTRLETSLTDAINVRISNPVWGNAALSGANILVEMLKIFLFVVATILDFVRPLTGSRNRAGVLLVLILVLFLFGGNIVKWFPINYLFDKMNKNNTPPRNGEL
ncbi:unnamed protein product [Caenorhabditis bovis]|uniref:Uncharacterized protein n=1 Tax=Caenorhabditis bovis TaxID=2654633 RepID=A0A8S1E960_9PELO|nr:unnamed protein product [Caenorhabditis bovis]